MISRSFQTVRRMREAWKRETYVRSQSLSSESAVEYPHIGRGKIQISPSLGEQDQSNAPPQGRQRQSYTINISSKVSNGLRMLYLARKLTDNQETLKTIYYSLVQPYFDYCDVVWGDCSKTRADKLQKLQNRAARIITRADYCIRSSDVLNSLEWSNLEERRKRHLLVTMFKIFNNDCPTYLRERFHRTSEIHDYNLRGSNYDLQLPLPKTNFLKRSFSYRGAMAWNQLSNERREMGDLSSFKLTIS